MEEHIVPSTTASIPPLPLAPNTTPAQHELDATPLIDTPESERDFELKYEEPLYTEINIPLPKVAVPQPQTASKPSSSSITAPAPASSSSTPQPPNSRGRSRTLSSLSPFRHRSNSSSSTTSTTEEWPRIRKDTIKNREVHAMMDLTHQNKRNRRGTIDALAVVPAVLVLSAELFTPEGDGGEGRKGGGTRKDSGVGRWEDGIR